MSDRHRRGPGEGERRTDAGAWPFFFTWRAQRGAEPLALVGGDGPWLHLEGGERLLDLGSLIYQANLGHGHPRLVEAVRAQASRLCLSIPGAVYPEKRALARALLDLAPPGFRGGKVFFTLGGSDANENALKIARLFTGRHKALARYRSYHGATFGAVALTGDWRRAAVEPALPGVVHATDLECAACPGGIQARDCPHEPLTPIPRVLEAEGPGTVAAVFLESVVGGNGVLIPPAASLARIGAACDRDGALLVLDEVLSGFGRTGRGFALEHFGVEPDLITVGKALTAGYGTLGAVLVSERVAGHFDDRVLPAGLTHYAHPLGVAAALEALAVYREEGLAARAARLEAPLRDGLEAMRLRAPGIVRRARVIGLLAAADLDLDADGWGRLPAALRRHGVHAHVQSRAGALVVAPPLNIPEDALADGLARVEGALAETARPR